MLWPLVAVSLAASNITIASRGESVAKLLKEASKQSGVVMESVPATGSEIVLVSLKDVTPEEFRKRLAAAVGARWAEETGGFRLVRPIEMIRAQEAEEAKLRIARIGESVAALQKRVAAQPPFDKPAADALARKVRAVYDKYKGHLSDAGGLREAMQLEPESPAGRFAIGAMALLSSKQIAEVGKGDRIVYSTNPTTMQRRFPSDITALTRRYVAEQKVFVEELKKIPTSESWANSWSPVLSRQAPEMPSQVLISTQRSPYNDALTVRVCLVDDEGKYLGQTQSLLDFNDRAKGEPLAKGTVKIAEDSRRFVDALKGLTSGKTFVDDQELLAKMERPEENDPLSFLAADGAFALAEGANFIASIPDDGFHEPSFTAMNPDGTLDLAKYSAWLTALCKVERTKDWMVVSPWLPVTTRNLRCDRAALGTFFRTARRSDGPTLEQLADFVAKMPSSYGETFVPMLAFFLLPSLNAGIDDRNHELLRIYGRLNVVQRDGLLKGNPLQLGQLTPASKADIARLIYRADSPISITMTGAPPETGHRFGLDTEVTYVLPNGPPAAGTIIVSSREDEAVIPDGVNAPVSSYQPMSAWSLAYTLVRAEFADPTDKREKVSIDKYRFGRTRKIEFQVKLTERVSIRAEMDETHFPPAGKSVAFDALPAAFRDAVEKAKVTVRRDHFSGAKGKVPPP